MSKDLKQNYESEKEELQSQFPDLQKSIEEKQKKVEQKQAKIDNDLISKKSKNTGKVVENLRDNTGENRAELLIKQAQYFQPKLSEIKQKKRSIAGIKLPGSGMQKGMKTKKTIMKEEARERYINSINQMQDKLIIAQSQLALGSMTVLAKVPYEENGKEKTRLEVIEDLQLIIDILSNTDLEAGSDYFVIKKTEPNPVAISYMLDQTIGKANQKIETTGEVTITNLIKKIGE